MCETVAMFAFLDAPNNTSVGMGEPQSTFWGVGAQTKGSNFFLVTP